MLTTVLVAVLVAQQPTPSADEGTHAAGWHAHFGMWHRHPDDGAQRVAHAVDSARALLAASGKAQPVAPLDTPSRRTIDFFPLLSRPSRPHGARLGAMHRGQRRATHALLRDILSEEGYLRAQAIRSLESELRARELGSSHLRQPDAYVAELFGTPTPDGAWGFRFEGHHLSVNAFFLGDQMRATPLFLGANPTEVASGPDAGLRVLATQQDLARALLDSLDEAQRSRAVEASFAPGMRIGIGAVRAPRTTSRGLPAAAMSEPQRGLLVRWIASFASQLQPALAADNMRRVEAAGAGELYFAWLGDTGADAPHTCVVQGPTIALQIDAIEDQPGQGAHHVHCLWSDPERDFGDDLLARHYRAQHDHGR